MNLIFVYRRKTVLSASKFWEKCKCHFSDQDPALILRLQVEYDHFILRAIASILSTQRYGVWKFISVIKFDGVSEAMMWHIIWVIYNNGRDEIDDLNGLCPYFSDAYWKAKFNEPAMKYLFQEKLPTLSVSESECLLISLKNMVISRESNEIDFINTVTVEMFIMNYLVPNKNETMITKCKEIFSELSKIHPSFVSALISKLKDAKFVNEV